MDIPAPGLPGTPKKQKKGNGAMGTEVEALGLVLPSAPQTAQELVETWAIPARDLENVSVNVHRQKLGTRETELVANVPVSQYDFRSIAAEHGPGVYYLKGSGRLARNVAKMSISQDYARQCGFGRIPEPPPAPPAQDVHAVRTLERVSTAAGIQGEELLSAIERACERAVESRLGHNAALAGMDPFAMQDSQFKAVERQMDFMAKMEERVRRSIPGAAPASGEDDEAFSWASLLKIITPAIPALVEAFKSRPAPVYAPQIPPPPQRPVQAQQPTIPAPPQGAPAENPAMKLIPHEDLQVILPAVRMLSPFTGILSGMASDPAKQAQEIALDLVAWIPPGCFQAITRLSELASEKGPEVLEIIGPQFRSDRWASIVHRLAEMLNEEPGEVGEVEP